MTIVTRATRFLKTLIRLPERPTCPKCGSAVWKKHGFRRRGQRCLDRLHRSVPLQRYRCLNPACQTTWSEHPPWLSPRRWYGRDVMRKSLDLCLDCTTSWRELAEVVRAEIAGTGRAQRWAPWRRAKKDANAARLAHTTTWRWFQEAASRAQTPERQVDRYAGLFSGILATDEAWGWVKGIVEDVGRKVEFGFQALVDGRTRVVLRLTRLVGESEEALRAGIARLPAVGVPLEAITTWLSDGSRTYPAVLAMLNLDRLPRQRSIFHLWRTLVGDLTAYGAAMGPEAVAALRAAVHAVWDAPTERLAVGALFTLVETYGRDLLARPIVGLVRATFSEAIYHLKELTLDLPRTTGVVEWLWRRFKRRMRLIQVFMGADGPDRFGALFELSVNFHRYQIRHERKRHYPYPGISPLEIAGQMLHIAVGEDRLVASWLDALEI